MRILSIFLVCTLAALAGAFIIGSAALYVVGGLLLVLSLVGIRDMMQTKHSIQRNFPVIGHFRWMFEAIRPEIQQYFVENETNGAPFSRAQRSDVYQKSKNVRNTVPFGTQFDLYQAGKEWVKHSIYPIKAEEVMPLTFVMGNHQCERKYLSSIINSSAMSFGALSQNAVMAINGGAKIAGFAQNTGEGGLSQWHLKNGGDVIWQVGTGYFGCREKDGTFSDANFTKNASYPQVKAIEIKLSQGAKPGHGGILPAIKNTPEIAAIRGVEPGTTVFSPTYHTAFKDAAGLVQFVGKLRKLSGGKPVGFKLCIGDIEELREILDKVIEYDIIPDFITVDGAEGGTGAAPLEFTNNVGTPLIDALVMVSDLLHEMKLKEHIRLIASGKVITGFDVVKMLALGADGVNMARGMLFSLGCIQARKCDSDQCPTGVATQDPSKYKGLVVEDKIPRVANFHKNLCKDIVELMAAMGINDTKKLKRIHICRRTTRDKFKTLEQIYPSHGRKKLKEKAELAG
jgi:glutamate synthase domain-containing protein 2